VLCRFSRAASLVDQVLAAAILANLAAFVLSTASGEGPHEIAVVVPFGAALGARVLGRGVPARSAAQWYPRFRTAGYAAGVAVLAGYGCALVIEAASPPVPPANARLASWLGGHGLRHGIGAYGQGSVVTVASGGRVTIRAVGTDLRPYLWLARPSWYSAAAQPADFVVVGGPGGLPDQPAMRELIVARFGAPERVTGFGPYRVWVYGRNLLTKI
jgi:hypothetical protein